MRCVTACAHVRLLDTRSAEWHLTFLWCVKPGLNGLEAPFLNGQSRLGYATLMALEQGCPGDRAGTGRMGLRMLVVGVAGELGP